jgi:signal transduction histidine kinase
VERLAEENRYAAMVRERLRIARDLHDTLAHSMMAMLAEVRILRRLHQHDPAALADELAHAEQVAQAGLDEARAAILRMRFHGVRDLGLGAALGDAVAHFTARTGIVVAYAADPQAAGFADARAETVFRIAEEALRNIERHAGASQVAVRLQDGDHGVVGLREQAQLIGATLAIDSTPGLGTTLRLGLGTEPDLAA